MTASLPARAAALRANLQRLEEMGADVQETARLTDLRRELAKEVEILERVTALASVLESEKIQTPNAPALATARSRAATLKNKFAEDTRAATLTKGTNWVSLLRDLKAAADEVASGSRTAWKEFRGSTYTGDAPAVIRNRIALTDKNAETYERYATKYQAFRSAFDALPERGAEIATVRELADDLKAIAGQFDFNVPDEVKAFLAAVQANGAALALLTPTVTAWLKDNDAFTAYRIVAA
jgi:hypothetical protein